MKHLSASIMAGMFLILSVPAVVPAAETCSMLGGTCKEACGPNETAESGAFLDCGESQKCCVKQETGRPPVRCCVHSFDSRNAGPSNCSEPVQDACPQGAASPIPCAKLQYCK